MISVKIPNSSNIPSTVRLLRYRVQSHMRSKIVKFLWICDIQWNLVILGTMKITLLYQVSHYIRVKKQRNIKSWDQQNYLVIRGCCYIRPLYNEVPLYYHWRIIFWIFWNILEFWNILKLFGKASKLKILNELINPICLNNALAQCRQRNECRC